MAQAKSKSDNLSKASEKLRIRQSEILTKLASKYTRESTTELISVTDAIEVVDEMIKKERKPPPLPEIGVISTGGRRGPHEED